MMKKTTTFLSLISMLWSYGANAQTNARQLSNVCSLPFTEQFDNGSAGQKSVNNSYEFNCLKYQINGSGGIIALRNTASYLGYDFNNFSGLGIVADENWTGANSNHVSTFTFATISGEAFKLDYLDFAAADAPSGSPTVFNIIGYNNGAQKANVLNVNTFTSTYTNYASGTNNQVSATYIATNGGYGLNLVFSGSNWQNIDSVAFVATTNTDVTIVIDNIALLAPVLSAPTITPSGTLTAFTTCAGIASNEQSFTISGADLTANLVATAPTGYEVSLTSGSGFSSSVNVTPTSGTVASTTVYARLTSAASGTPSGNITIASTGATSQNVAVEGTVTQTPDAPNYLSADPICGEGSVTFMDVIRTTTPSSPYKIYDAQTDGNLVASDLTTPALTETTDFWATYTNNGCESARTKITATVNSIPNAPTWLYADPICGEGTVTFMEITRTAMPSSPYKLYDAQTDGNEVSSDLTTPTISQTTYFWATYSDNGCESARTIITAEVKQIPLSPYVMEPNAVCDSGSFMLSAVPGSNGRVALCRECDDDNIYLWKNAEGDSVYNDADFQTPMLYNYTYYIVTAANECGVSSPISVNIPINKVDLPTLNSPSICLGTSAELVATYNAPTRLTNARQSELTPEFVWYNFNMDSLATTDVYTTDNLFEGTDYFVKVKLFGCESAKKSTSVNIFQVDTSVSVSNGIISANTENQIYQWVNMDTKTIIDGATENAYSPLVTGNYAVVITQSFDIISCTDTSGARYVEMTLTDVEKSAVSNFTLYPNPASDNVTVTFTESVSGSVSIVDLHGNVVATKSISGNNTNISTADLASGVYVVKISSDKGVAVKQLVIQ